ncbi:MAG: RNA-binding S4 domain-containing protein [Clostridia bacterium]
MRLDKFLKTARLIKRRTIANQAAGAGRVVVNGRTAKPSTQIKEGDVIEISYGKDISKVRVLNAGGHSTKQGAGDLYEMIE